MTLLTNFPPDIDPDEPYVRAPGFPKKFDTTESPSTPDGDSAPQTVTIPIETWHQILTAIDNASAIITHNETIADQMDALANTLTALTTKLRHQANAIRSNRQRLNATLYPATSTLRQLYPPRPEIKH